LIVTVVLVETALVVSVAFPEVAPAATNTDAGVCTTVESELLSAIETPPEGAAALRVTFNVTEFPPVTDVADTDIFAKSASTIRVSLAETPWNVAVNVTTRAAVARVVLTGTDTEVAPAGTVTEDGTDATLDAELARLTTIPPAGAAAVRFTVSWLDFPPTIADGDTVTFESEAGFTVTVAVFVTPFVLAVKVTVVETITAFVVTVTVVLVAPAGTVTEDGTGATVVFELAKRTTMPPDGAALVSVTVNLEVLPPPTVAGERLSAVRVAAGFTVTRVDLLTPP